MVHWLLGFLNMSNSHTVLFLYVIKAIKAHDEKCLIKSEASETKPHLIHT